MPQYEDTVKSQVKFESYKDKSISKSQMDIELKQEY
jgi:hypothetical protein